MLDLISLQITNIIKEIEESDKKLKNLKGRCRENEILHNKKLRALLRKMTSLANDTSEYCYCSICGLRFNNKKQRTIHVSNTH